MKIQKPVAGLTRQIQFRARRIPQLMSLLMILALLAACAPQPEATASPSNVNAPTAVSPSPDKPSLDGVKPTPVLPEKVTPIFPSGGTSVEGEVPDALLNKIMGDLVQRQGVQRQSIQVIKAEAVTWNDGSLGCPEPGMYYTQSLVDGYWVILEVNGATYDYRVTAGGNFRLCEPRLPTP